MIHDKTNHTCDGEPTLTDSQVLEFCREGHLLLRGVVPDGINRRTCDYLEGEIPANPSYIPDGMTEADLRTDPLLQRAQYHLPRGLVH